MAAQKINWKIRHIMKDGRVLKPGERLPITPEGIEVFERVGEIVLRATKRMQREKEAVANA